MNQANAVKEGARRGTRGSPTLSEAAPGSLGERGLHLLDVGHSARVVPAARVPRSDAAPEDIGPAVRGGDLPHRLPPVEPGAAVVEIADVAGAQPGRVEVDREGRRAPGVRHAAPDARPVATLVLDLGEAEGADRRIAASAAISPRGLMPVRLDDADGAEEVLVDPPAASGPREHLGRRAGELSLDEPNPLRPGGPVAIRGGRAPGVRAVADG